eukprot:2096905-Lingulodinium_polyedra.AAC.1
MASLPGQWECQPMLPSLARRKFNANSKVWEANESWSWSNGSNERACVPRPDNRAQRAQNPT